MLASNKTLSLRAIHGNQIAIAEQRTVRGARLGTGGARRLAAVNFHCACAGWRAASANVRRSAAPTALVRDPAAIDSSRNEV